MIKTARIILCLGLLILSPLAAYGRDLGPSHVPDNWCRSAEKGGCEGPSLAAFGAHAHRINKTTLALTLRTGRKVVLSNPNDCYDNPIGDQCEHFSLSFYFRKRGFFLIGVGRYEWVEWILLNDRTGKQTRLLGPPTFSPSGQEFVLAINQGSSSGISGAFEVWSLRSGTPVRSLHYEPAAAVPLEGKADWQGDDRIALSYDNYPPNGPYDRAHIQNDTAVRERDGWWLAPRDRPATPHGPWLAFEPAEKEMKAAQWELLDLGIIQLHAAKLTLRKWQVAPYAARHQMWLAYDELETRCPVVGLDPALPGLLEIWLKTDDGNLVMPAPINLEAPGAQPTSPREVDFDDSEPSLAAVVLRGRCASPG